MYIIDATSDSKYFIIYKDDKQLMKISKMANSLEIVEQFIGLENIKEIK